MVRLEMQSSKRSLELGEDESLLMCSRIDRPPDGKGLIYFLAPGGFFFFIFMKINGKNTSLLLLLLLYLQFRGLTRFRAGGHRRLFAQLNWPHTDETDAKMRIHTYHHVVFRSRYQKLRRVLAKMRGGLMISRYISAA